MIRSGYPGTGRTMSILPRCDTSANTTPTHAGYDGPSPTLWEIADWQCQERGTFEATVGNYLPSPCSVELEVRSAKYEDVPRIRQPMRGRSEMKKDIGGGVQRSMKTGMQRRNSAVDRLVSKATRWAEVMYDDEKSWDTQDFVDPRPAPTPPATKRQPMEWTLYSQPRGEASTRPGKPSSAMKSSIHSSRCENPRPVVPEPPKIESPRVYQQPTPEELHRPLFLETPLFTIPRQKLGGDDIPLPTVTATCPPPHSGVPDTGVSRFSLDSVDASMDRVYVQIQDCLSATERMDKILFSCNHIDHEAVANVCYSLKRSLKEMQRTIDQGSSCVELDTPQKMAWSHQREALETSVQKNVRKYYQLATFTANKPPRIDRLESRLDKLEAYLEKFQDLNSRILASYDKLQIIELEERLALAATYARRHKAEEVARQRKLKLQSRIEKRKVDELRRDIQELRTSRTNRLLGLETPESLLSPLDSGSITPPSDF